MWEANFTVKGSARFHTPPDRTAARGGPAGLALALPSQFRPFYLAQWAGPNGSGESQVGCNEADG